MAHTHHGVQITCQFACALFCIIQPVLGNRWSVLLCFETEDMEDWVQGLKLPGDTPEHSTFTQSLDSCGASYSYAAVNGSVVVVVGPL